MQSGVIAAQTRPSLSASRGVSKSQSALSTETPVNSSAWQHNAGDLATELLFQGWTPGHELETETIIDHGEPA